MLDILRGRQRELVLRDIHDDQGSRRFTVYARVDPRLKDVAVQTIRAEAERRVRDGDWTPGAAYQIPETRLRASA